MKVKHSPFIIEKEAKALTAVLPQIQALADSEKDALGFLPARAFQEAIIRGRLVAALVEQNGIRTFAGYLLHSGVFPNAKIQQISVNDAFRKQGAASALIKALVSELERIGFLSLQSAVVGFAVVEAIVRSTPQAVWQIYSDKVAISRLDFDHYFDGAKEAIGILLSMIERVQPVAIEKLRLWREGFHPPQVLARITTLEAKRLIEMASV